MVSFSVLLCPTVTGSEGTVRINSGGDRPCNTLPEYDVAMATSEHPYLYKPSLSTGSQCNKAYSVKEDETCYAVMKMFKVNEKSFYSILNLFY